MKEKQMRYAHLIEAFAGQGLAGGVPVHFDCPRKKRQLNIYPKYRSQVVAGGGAAAGAEPFLFMKIKQVNFDRRLLTGLTPRPTPQPRVSRA